MKRLLIAVFLLPFASFGADPIPLMLNTNRTIAWQTNFFLINGELMTNALVALGYSSGGGSVASTDITDSTVAGRALLTAANASAQLTALGTASLYEPLNDNKYQATNGNLTTLGTLDGAALTNINGSSIASGTVAAARFDAAMATDVEVAAAITANTNFAALNVGTMVVTNFSVGTTNVPAELALKANALNPTTTGTLTHGGTNIVATPTNLTFNIWKANALVIGTNGNVGVGVVPGSTFALEVTGSSYASGNSSTAGKSYSASVNDASGGYSTASLSTLGGIFAAKAVSASQYLIRSNAPSTAAARGANTLVQEFNTNQFRIIATDASTNETVMATLSTAGALELLATPTAGTSNNVVATTKFVKDAVAAAGGGTPAPANLTWSAFSVLTDASLSSHFRVTLTNASSATLANPSNPTDGKLATWEIAQDATGSRLMTFDTKWAFGSDITGAILTTNASKRDFIRAVYNSTADKWFVVGFLRGY